MQPISLSLTTEINVISFNDFSAHSQNVSTQTELPTVTVLGRCILKHGDVHSEVTKL